MDTMRADGESNIYAVVDNEWDVVLVTYFLGLGCDLDELGAVA